MMLLEIVSMGGSGCTAVPEDDSDELRSRGGLSATNELGRTGSDALAYFLMLTHTLDISFPGLSRGRHSR
jgi:hypothetical protein